MLMESGMIVSLHEENVEVDQLPLMTTIIDDYEPTTDENNDAAVSIKQSSNGSSQRYRGTIAGSQGSSSYMSSSMMMMMEESIDLDEDDEITMMEAVEIDDGTCSHLSYLSTPPHLSPVMIGRDRTDSIGDKNARRSMSYLYDDNGGGAQKREDMYNSSSFSTRSQEPPTLVPTRRELRRQQHKDKDHYRNDFFDFVTPPLSPVKPPPTYTYNIMLSQGTDQSENESETSDTDSTRIMASTAPEIDYRRPEEFQMLLGRIRDNSHIYGSQFFEMVDRLRSMGGQMGELLTVNMDIYNRTCMDLLDETYISMSKMKALINNMELLNADLFEMYKLSKHLY
eukprot:gene8044-9452_t